MQKSTLFRIAVLSLLSPAVLISSASAYQYYSKAGTEWDPAIPGSGRTGNCATSGCHGDYRKTGYLSTKADHTPWTGTYFNTRLVPPATETITSLHDIHRRLMGVSCNACHTAAGQPGQDGTHYPVNLSSSDGSLVNGVKDSYTVSCGGCHQGAGLRQHHTRVLGIATCAVCHDDNDPATFTPPAENVLPSYYAIPDGLKNKPFDPCNGGGIENFAGSLLGLDNDGNLAYDMDDAACMGKLADIHVSPLTLDFGPDIVPGGTSKTLSTTIQNQGTGMLYVGFVNRCAATGTLPATSTEFTWSPVYMAIAPGTSQDLAVKFSPLTDGTDTGCLEIINNDPFDAKTTKIDVTAKGSKKSGLLPIYIPAIVKPAK